MWRTIGSNIAAYRTYPRIVGETGGKDFVFAHPSADAGGAGHRAGARRLRVPGAEVLGRLAAPTSRSRSGRRCATACVAELGADRRWATPTDFRNFMGAVIDEASFDNTMGYIEQARAGAGFEIVAGGARRQVDGLLRPADGRRVRGPALDD